MVEKYEMASPEWIGEARKILENRLGEVDLTGIEYSACEEITHLPEVLGGGSTGHHFRIEHGKVTTYAGLNEDVLVYGRCEWSHLLPIERTVYAELLDADLVAATWREAGVKSGKMSWLHGEYAEIPPVLIPVFTKVHDDMARMTK